MTQFAEDILNLIPPETIQQHRIVPLAVEGDVLQVGVSRSPEPGLLRDLAFVTGKTIVPVKVEAATVDDLSRHTPGRTMTVEGGSRW